MTSEDIYAILASKPHNSHYLKRYVKFIFSCTHQPGEYTEKHHICPKATDLFPEYRSFRQYPWNRVVLTARQHIIAHLLLWKSFPSFSGACSPIYYMLNVQNSDTIRFSRRKIPSSILTRYVATIKTEFFNKQLGFSTYKDSNGVKYFLHRDDPLIQELNLVGNNAGIQFSDETKHRLRNCNRKTATVQLYFLDSKIKVKYNTNPGLYVSLIDQGWLPYHTEDDLKYIRERQGMKTSLKLKGRTAYARQDGSYYGKLYKDDPAIKELNLILYKTETQVESNRRNQRIAAKRNIGSTVYNNGEIEIKRHAHPGEGWVVGRLPRLKSHDMNQRVAASKARKNTFVVNDGVRNKYLKIGEPLPDGYSIGMAPRVQR